MFPVGRRRACQRVLPRAALSAKALMLCYSWYFGLVYAADSNHRIGDLCNGNPRFYGEIRLLQEAATHPSMRFGIFAAARRKFCESPAKVIDKALCLGIISPGVCEGKDKFIQNALLMKMSP